MNLKQTLVEIRQGNQEAYLRIVRHYSPEVRLYLARRVPDFHAVEDLAQEVFVAAYWSLEKFNGDNFNGWLRGITKNKMNEYLRRQYSSSRKLEKFKADISRQLNRLSTPGESRLKRELQLCIDKLPDKMRGLLKARYHDNCAVQEIARRQQTTPASISNHLYRLRKILRDCLETGTP